jgi:hypothetical protein
MAFHAKNQTCLMDKADCILYSCEPKSLKNCRNNPYRLLRRAALTGLSGGWLWAH